MTGTWQRTSIVAPRIETCVICGKPTRFIEVHFEAPLHPGVCADAMWWDYDDANRKLGPLSPPGAW